MSKRDLFVVVPDLDAELVLKALLGKRQDALGIRLDFGQDDLLRYSGRDNGCYSGAEDLLRPKVKTHPTTG